MTTQPPIEFVESDNGYENVAEHMAYGQFRLAVKAYLAAMNMAPAISGESPAVHHDEECRDSSGNCVLGDSPAISCPSVFSSEIRVIDEHYIEEKLTEQSRYLHNPLTSNERALIKHVLRILRTTELPGDMVIMSRLADFLLTLGFKNVGDCAVKATQILEFLKPYRPTVPVSVSLVKCREALYAKHAFMTLETAEQIAETVLDAAGVAYVE